MIFSKPLRDIDLDDIQQLIDEGTEESLILEYKREINFTKQGKKEIIRDVSAFANSKGGVIIYGVDEERESEDHAPTPKTELCWIIDERGDIKERLESIIISSIQPKVNVQIKPIRDENTNRSIFITRIPESPYAPHMVIKDRENRYYKRYNFRRELMDEYDVRTLYRRNARMFNRLEQFLNSRGYGLKDIESDNGARCTLVVCPLILEDHRIKLHDNELWDWLNPNERRRYQHHTFLPSRPEPSLDGIFMGDNLAFLDERRNHIENATFMEICRNGCIEYSFICSRFHEGQGYLNQHRICLLLIEVINFSGELYERIEYYGPVKIVLGIKNVQNHVLISASRLFRPFGHYGRKYLKNELQVPIEKEAPLLRPNVMGYSKEIIDILHHAFGIRDHDLFDNEGNYRVR